MSGVDLNLNLIYKHIFNKGEINKEISSVGRQMSKHWANITQQSFGTYYKSFSKAAKTFIDKDIKAVTGSRMHEQDLTDMFTTFLTGMNRKGRLSAYMSKADIAAKRKNLSSDTINSLARRFARVTMAGELFQEQQEKQEQSRLEKEELKKDTSRFKNVDRYAKTTTKSINKLFSKKSDAERLGNLLFKGIVSSSKDWSKQLKENNKSSKNTGVLLRRILQGKWGVALGGTIAGAAIYGAYKVLKKGFGYAYSTSMQGLDWQRTISGGASGGSWFGQGLASYQRAGIGANQYQGFKRGIQGYLGSVKLGMGNAAPLMYLGLSALGNTDELEKELEKGLRRLPKDVSLALAGQMGLDYKMWEAIYSGRLDREKSAYSEKAIQEWANLANNLNDLITNLKTFFFNNLAPIVGGVSKFVGFINKGSSWSTALNTTSLVTSLAYPTPAGIGSLLGQAIKFGAVEVIVKNENGEIIEKKETDVMFEMGSGDKR